VQKLSLVVWWATAIGTLGFAWAMSPLVTGQRMRGWADRLPVVGHTLTRLVDAAAVYHSRRLYVFAALGLALVTHCLLILSFWFTSRGLPVFHPTLRQDIAIVPPSLVAGTLPLTPGGLGTTEAVVEFFYVALGAAKGDGTIVALSYRAMTYFFAAAGACYYLTARKKIDVMLHEAEELAEELE
jgi:glycosyltransferase 2 family protein